jgi:hypothetical protein
MGEAAENGKELLHSAHANGMNVQSVGKTDNTGIKE